MLNMEVNGRILHIQLAPGPAAEALKDFLKDDFLELPMKDYAHMEKFGDLGVRLPEQEEYMTTRAGDLILWEERFLVLYYASNTWKFTKLGQVADMTGQELRRILGSGNITAKFWLSGE